MQRPDVLAQLGYIWRHVSAVKRRSSGQQGIVLLRYSQIVCDKQFDCTLTILFFVGLRMAVWRPKHVARYNHAVLIHLVFAYVVY